MSNVTAGYGRLSDSIAFFGNIHILQHVRNVIASSNFYKLCVKAEAHTKYLVCGRSVELKSKPM